MSPTKRRKVQRSIIESDEENETELENDPIWTPDDNDKEQPQCSNIDTSTPEDSAFDSTEGFRLKKVEASKQSNQLIWNLFGQLIKDEKPVTRVKDRIYCIRCFEKKTFKR